MTDQEITESARAWIQSRLTDIAAEADLWRSRGRDWHDRALCAVGAVMHRTSPITPSYRDDFMREAFMSYCSVQGGAQTLAHRERRDALLAAKTDRTDQAAIIATAFANRGAAMALTCDPESWRPTPRNVFRAIERECRLSDDFTARVKRRAYSAGERGEVSPLTWIRHARSVRDAVIADTPKVSVSHLQFRPATSL